MHVCVSLSSPQKPQGLDVVDKLAGVDFLFSLPCLNVD